MVQFQSIERRFPKPRALKKDTKLLSVGALSLDVIVTKLFEAGTTVEFDDKGIVIKALKE